MKLIGNLLVWICITTGLIAASSFYVWSVGPDATADSRFELGTSDDGTVRYAQLLQELATKDGNTIAPADADLDPDALAFIRQAGMKRVIIKHPSGALGVLFSNWTGKWLFLGSVIGLVAGAMALRVAARREVEQADQPDSVQATPEEIVGKIRAAISDLRGSLGAIESVHDKEQAIIHVLDEVQGDLVPAFVDTRAVIISRRGMGGYAHIMDKFASMERQINRAWSAAADNVLPESVQALESAAVLADELAETIGIGKH